jgi:hypothetical protein
MSRRAKEVALTPGMGQARTNTTTNHEEER